MSTITATFHAAEGSAKGEVRIKQAVIAGWTGRDKAAVEKHIKELEAVGVKRPSSTPIFYRVSASRITTATEIEATGTASSGEVEFALLQANGQLWVGVGSDHTDREVETYGVTVSKQMCDKPVAGEFWPFSDAAPHWDKIILRAFIQEDGKRVLYQEGTVDSMIAPGELIKLYTGADTLPEDTIMFCGTFAAKGGIRPSDRFDYEIEDPVLNRKITAGYSITSLPVLG
ncbi:MAG: DUF2848 domain-containing protein [Hyphomicrobiaceae bacterium]